MMQPKKNSRGKNHVIMITQSFSHSWQSLRTAGLHHKVCKEQNKESIQEERLQRTEECIL